MESLFKKQLNKYKKIVIVGNKCKISDHDLTKLKKAFSHIEFVPESNHVPHVEERQVIVNNSDLEIEGSVPANAFMEACLGKTCNIDPNPIKPKIKYKIKYLIEFPIVIVIMIFSAPLLLYSAYRIKKESPEGPIIFKQKRVGKDGVEFTCYKLRTMVPDAEKGTPQFAEKNDPRTFSWGKVMRKTRIDEIPQLFNIIKGDMCLIGPRPERRFWVEKFEKQIPRYSDRNLVKPGITGWAQVNYPYGQTTDDAEQKLMYDLYYIKNWSVVLEIKIIFKTIATVLKRSGQ